MRRLTAPVFALVVLLVAAPVVGAVPAAPVAGAAPSGSTASPPSTGTAASSAVGDGVSRPVESRPFDGTAASTAGAVPDSSYNDTALLALAAAGDGAVVGGGLSGSERPNATLMRIDADGRPDWTTRVTGPNATRIVDVAVADDGDVFFLLSERTVDPEAGFGAGDLRLGRATDDGEITWQTSLSARSRFGAFATLVASDDGATVAHRLPEDGGVRLAEYAGGDAIWAETYGVDGAPRALRTTADGYLLAGTGTFEEPWVIRTTESGRVQFNQTLPGVTGGRVVGAVPTEDGGAVVAGWRTTTHGSFESAAWAARVGGDGVTRWARVYGAGTDLRVRDVFARDGGLVLLGNSQSTAPGDGTTRLVGVAADGGQLFVESVALSRVTAATRTGDSLTVAGVRGLARERFTSRLSTVPIPAGGDESDPLAPDVGVSSNATAYLGQNLRFVDAGAGPRTQDYHLVRLPDGAGEVDPQVVRRVAPGDDGEAVVETATLPPGEYVLRTTDGRNVTVADGRITGPAGPRDPAAFTLRAQRFFRVETNRTFVDAAAGERAVSFRLSSERTGYAVYATADRSRGGPASAAALRAVFGDVRGFEGVERVDGRPVARIAVSESRRINASVAALGAGMYEVGISSVDTRDAGAVASTRVVVSTDAGSALGVELGTRTLRVAVGEETETNVTLTNVTNGISALSLSANRTGPPAVGLSFNVGINGSRSSLSAGISERESTAGAAQFGGDTPNGTVRVGTLGVSGNEFLLAENATGTNTVTFRVDWVVDENGVPYAVPDPATVTVRVVPAADGTDGGSGEDAGGAAGGGSASGSESGSSRGS